MEGRFYPIRTPRMARSPDFHSPAQPEKKIGEEETGAEPYKI